MHSINTVVVGGVERTPVVEQSSGYIATVRRNMLFAAKVVCAQKEYLHA